MNGFNRVFIMGYLGKTPEKVMSKQGKNYVRLSVATHHNQKLSAGDYKKTTTWHKVNVFGKTADKCENHLQTGAAIAVEGYLSNYSYKPDDGPEIHKTAITGQQVHFLGRKNAFEATIARPDFETGGDETTEEFMTDSESSAGQERAEPLDNTH